jgi:hypothetical protein
VLQPELDASFRGFSLSGWTSLVVAGDPNRGRFIDVGGLASYRRGWGDLTVEPRFELNWFPYASVSTAGELGLKVSYLIGWDLRLVTEHGFDVVAHPGAYFGSLGLAFSREFDHDLSLEIGVSVGLGSGLFNSVYFSTPKTTFDVLEELVALTWSPRDWLVIRPHLGLSAVLDPDLRCTVSHPTSLIAGLALGLRLGDEAPR